jgi:hypothetical protein
MTRITLFTATIGDGPAKLAVAVTQTFDSSDTFVVSLGGDSWPMSTRDAELLAAAGMRIEGALDYAAQRGERVSETVFYNRQLGGEGNAVTFEIGIDCSGEFAAPYLSWRDRRIVDSTGRLLKMLATLGDACSSVRRAGGAKVQDIQLDLRNYRSPFAWRGE